MGEDASGGDLVGDCLECGGPIRKSDKYLLLSTADGKRHALHTVCFTNTTFDPDRFSSVNEPESERR